MTYMLDTNICVYLLRNKSENVLIMILTKGIELPSHMVYTHVRSRESW